MSGVSLWSSLKAALSLAGKLVPFGRRLMAERKAGEKPYSVSTDRAEKLLDESLRRLGSIASDDTMWKGIIFRAAALYTRPADFHKPHVREWLSRTDVRHALKQITKSRANGEPEKVDAYKLLVETYMANSGESNQHAEGIVERALGFLEASLQSSATDPGTAGLVQTGFKGVHQRFDIIEKAAANIAANAVLFGDGILADHHSADARQALDAILKRRASPKADTLTELRQLARDIGAEGKYRASTASTKGEILSWLARVAAAKGNVTEAEQALNDAKSFGAEETKGIAAYLDVARGNVDDALRRLRGCDDADSRTVLFSILRLHHGLNQALAFFDSLGDHSPSQFTAIGWRNIGGSLIEGNRLKDAVDLLSALPENFISECPPLGYVQGVAYSAYLVPEVHRYRVIDEAFLLATDHLLEGSDADRWRKAASEAFERAQQAAEKIGDVSLVEVTGSWIRWLRLIDPVQRETEIAALRAGMMEGVSAVELIAFTMAFGVKFDPDPLERYLTRAEAIGGLSRKELNAKILLLKVNRRFEELARFIEDNWERLVDEQKPAALTGLLIETYISAGEHSRAEDFLSERQDLLYPPDIPRFRLMLEDSRGEDPTRLAFKNYETTESVEDLWNLVKGLERVKRWGEMAPYARKLFDLEPTSENALRYVACLIRLKALEEVVLEFLDNAGELVERAPDLSSAKAWALFHVGRINEAGRLNNQLLSIRWNPNDIGLDINIAMRMGEWERFTDILGREWERRNELPISILLLLAKLAGARAPERAIQLIQDAVKKSPCDPHVLLQAYGVATALARDDIGMPWVHQAAALSKEGKGPVQTYSFREMVELIKDNQDDWRRKNELFRTGQVPLHLAASMFNVPLSRFFISIPNENKNQPDARKRFPVPVRSGARNPISTKDINKIVLDITTIFILSELCLLDTAIDTLDEVFVSPRVMELLLFEREKVEFHQPSRIKKIKPLLEMARNGQFSVVTHSGPDWLISESGEEVASLLYAAKQAGGVCIHSGKIYKVGSYMDVEAEVGEFSNALKSPSAIAVTLYEDGILDGRTFEKAKDYLDKVGGCFPVTAVAPDSPVYLDNPSVQYLLEVEIIIPLINSGRRLFIHPSVVEEWEALVSTEHHTAEMIEALDRIRLSLRKGMDSKRVAFLREGRRDGDIDKRFALPGLPIIDIFEDVGLVDAVCIDDRVLNGQPFLEDKKGRKVPVLCTLDILDLLYERTRISVEERSEAIHTMCEWVFFTVPIEENELFNLLMTRERDQGGDLKESAELRTIREYLAQIHSSGVLSNEADLAYLDRLWYVGLNVIQKLWAVEVAPVDLTMIRSNWVIDHVMPDIELALRFASNKMDRLEDVATARLVAFQLVKIPFERREAYAEWLEKTVVAGYLPANFKILDRAAGEIMQRMVTLLKEVPHELRNSDGVVDNSQPT